MNTFANSGIYLAGTGTGSDYNVITSNIIFNSLPTAAPGIEIVENSDHNYVAPTASPGARTEFTCRTSAMKPAE